MPAHRIIVHVGLGKTGTSALQTFLVRNRKALARHGVRYPPHRRDADAARGESVPGNGRFLMPVTVPSDPAVRAKALARLERVVQNSARPTVLLSSEFLEGITDEGAATLAAWAAERGLELEVVLYLRDHAGHAWSLYTQRVKRHHEQQSFGQWLESTYQPADGFRTRLEALRRHLGESLTVLHYDTERADLVGGFLRRVLGVEETNGFDRDLHEVNRSLTTRDVGWMLHVNRTTEPAVRTGWVGDLLAAAPALPAPRPSVSPAELALLEREYGDYVAWVNETFFGAPLLSATGGLPAGEEADNGVEEPTEAERFLLDRLVEAIPERPLAAVPVPTLTDEAPATPAISPRSPDWVNLFRLPGRAKRRRHQS